MLRKPFIIIIIISSSFFSVSSVSASNTSTRRSSTYRRSVDTGSSRRTPGCPDNSTRTAPCRQMAQAAANLHQLDEDASSWQPGGRQPTQPTIDGSVAMMCKAFPMCAPHTTHTHARQLCAVKFFVLFCAFLLNEGPCPLYCIA